MPSAANLPIPQAQSCTEADDAEATCPICNEEIQGDSLDDSLVEVATECVSSPMSARAPRHYDPSANLHILAKPYRSTRSTRAVFTFGEGTATFSGGSSRALCAARP